jgi:putative flippase GtrA
MVVGLMATAVYAAGAFALSFTMPAATASVTAHAIAAIFSYCGHKYLTFGSDETHTIEAPRFLALTATGLMIAWGFPLVLTDGLGFPALVSIGACCLFVPVFNYIVLNRWVFRDAR